MKAYEIKPPIPNSVATFDATDFGAYQSNGYNPSRIAGVMRGVPIRYLYSGSWLFPDKAGKSGTMFVFRDTAGGEVGRVHMPSESCNWSKPLTFVPKKA